MSHAAYLKLANGGAIKLCGSKDEVIASCLAGLPDKRKPARGAVVHIRCWADQKAAWQLAAANAGMTLSEWICSRLG